MTGVRMTIRGLQEAQKANLELLAAMRPDGAVGRTIVIATAETHRRLTRNTPHDIGALRATRRTEVIGLRGRVYNDPGARNPRSRTPPAEYDVYLHAQGRIPGLRSGIRASMPYTVEHDGPKIAHRAIKLMVKGFPQ